MSDKLDRKNRPKILLVVRSLVLNDKNQILLIKRCSKEWWKPGKWELPGGKVEIGQDASTAMEREVFEETGLVIEPIDKIAYWNSNIAKYGKYKGMSYLEIIGTAKANNSEVKLSKEHDDHTWVGIQKALEKDLVRESREAIQVLKNKKVLI